MYQKKKKKDTEASQTDLETLPKVSQFWTRAQLLVNARFGEAGSVAGPKKASSLGGISLNTGVPSTQGWKGGMPGEYGGPGSQKGVPTHLGLDRRHRWWHLGSG